MVVFQVFRSMGPNDRNYGDSEDDRNIGCGSIAGVVKRIKVD